MLQITQVFRERFHTQMLFSCIQLLMLEAWYFSNFYHFLSTRIHCRALVLGLCQLATKLPFAASCSTTVALLCCMISRKNVDRRNMVSVLCMLCLVSKLSVKFYVIRLVCGTIWRNCPCAINSSISARSAPQLPHIK